MVAMVSERRIDLRRVIWVLLSLGFWVNQVTVFSVYPWVLRIVAKHEQIDFQILMIGYEIAIGDRKGHYSEMQSYLE